MISEASALDPTPDLRPWESRRLRAPHGNETSAATPAEGLAGPFAALLLLVALLLGGGTRNYLFTDLVVQLLASALLIYGLARLRWTSIDVPHRQLLGMAALVLLLPLLQLLPLPTAVMQWFPGRGDLWSERAKLGLDVPVFAAWSLDPNATLAAFRTLLPATALVVLGSQLGAVWRRRLVLIVVAVAILNVPFGIAQVAQGVHSDLRPYTPTNVHDAVGLFANRNHYAALLVCGLVFVFGGLLLNTRAGSARTNRTLHMAGWMLLGGMLLLGDMLSRSRAGVGLAALVALTMLVIAYRRRREQPQIFRSFLVFIVLGGLLAFQFGFVAIADRLGQVGDQRWDVTAGVLAVSSKFAWLGSGIGSFPAVYAAHEPLDLVGSRILNHAHNDWAELWVDLGIVLIPMALLLVRFLWLRIAELRAGDNLARPEHGLRLVGITVLIVLCVHSLVDYPLRTTAVSSVFALAAVLACTAVTPGKRKMPRDEQRAMGAAG